MISHQQYHNANILIVDDQTTNILLLQQMLHNAGYKHIHSTHDSTKVINLFRELNPDLICLDIHMPHINGLQVMGQLKVVIKEAFLPILVITSGEDRDIRLRALEAGAKDFINKPFDKAEVLMRIRNLLETSLLHKAVSQQNDHLEETIQTRTRELQETQFEVVHRLARAAEYRDNETGAHIVRMSHFAVALGRACGMSNEDCDVLYHATPMHDVGKLGIPDKILLKPDKLTPEEFEIMKQHTIIGAQLLANGQSPILKMGEIIALTHHEKWDGSGYPNGLAGEDIPLPGRICALADVFDALSSKRCYKEAWPIDKTMAEIQALSAKQFDPHLVQIFLDLLPVFLDIQSTYSDLPTPICGLAPISFLS